MKAFQETLAAILVEFQTLNTTLARLIPEVAPTPDFSHSAFRWVRNGHQGSLEALARTGQTALSHLQGIDEQKAALDRNTQQFIRRLPANNALLWGARGTGKSSLIRALLDAYENEGLRVIEVDRSQMADLPLIGHLVRHRPERFILFFDDLAFESDDRDYKALKAALEGSLSTLPENVLIYATSNRRHLLPELIESNLLTKHHGTEIHPGEVVEETLSLSERFGLWLSFHPFTQTQYLDIVHAWFSELGNPELTEDDRREALAYALLRGSRSGRVARQFAHDRIGRQRLEGHN